MMVLNLVELMVELMVEQSVVTKVEQSVGLLVLKMVEM